MRYRCGEMPKSRVKLRTRWVRLRASEDAAEDDVTLAPGQIFVVSRGVQHCPTTTDGALVLMSEPQGTPNTGDAGGERTREPDELP